MKRIVAAALVAAIVAGCGGQPVEPTPPKASTRLLVKFKGDGGVVASAVLNAAQARAVDDGAARLPFVVDAPELARIGWIVVDAGDVERGNAMTALAAVDGVVAVVDDATRRVVEPVSVGPSLALDPMVGAQWFHAKLGSANAWNAGLLGAKVVVAIVDTGVECTHPDLHCRDAGKDFTGSGSTADGYGHGTHVAGIAAAIGGNNVFGSGIAPKADLLPVRVLDKDGSGLDSWIASGIVYAADAGAAVVNLSLGGNSPAPILDDALNYAVGRGAFVACAAGNSGTNRPTYPNVYPGCIGVAATVKDGEGGASWTNYGVNADVGAPGDAIMSTCVGGRACQMSGTSMASPVIAGVAALAIGAGVKARDVLAIVNATGVPLTGRLAGLKRPNLTAFAAAIPVVPPTATRIAPTKTPVGGPTASPFPGSTATVPSVGLPWPCMVVEMTSSGATARPCAANVVR